MSSAIGVLILATGCGTSDGEGATGASTASGQAMAADVPAGFDTCKDIPKAVLDSEGLHKASSNNNADYDGAGGVKWRGCSWVMSDGYGVGITTTNLTVEKVRANTKLTVRDEYVVNGRSALATSRADHKNPRSVCTLNVAMQGGSLEFSLDNPDSRDKTGHLDTCMLARGLAEKIVPLIPANA
ncbi:DUF3558 domain-containing protein [Nocardia neocaledoniensis]|uniref:DUF3558 domain-containing protein n=1 Tax=Nocardia neocaledoniensis TaxID=236511 RepID=UPI002458EE58|nr:DUF3558 domain-containing protein [Nocardia neocaledoniensis]